MLGFMGIYILGQALWFFPQDTGLIIGPLVYFYLKSQTNVQFKFQTRDYWHFLPYFVYFFYHLLFFLSGKEGVDWWVQSVHNRLFVGIWERIAENVSLWVYMILSLRLYQRYRFNGYIQVQPHRLTFDTNKASGSDVAPNHPEASIKKTEKPDPVEVQTWCKRLETIMQREKLYLNPELTLSDLAEKLHTHNSWISYVINTGFRKNFNDFVNAYRVADFQQKINDPQLSHYTLLALAFECGFNSKSTFNRAVKKATGQLPSTFGTKAQQ